jgi:large subunit ribosomal protein L17
MRHGIAGNKLGRNQSLRKATVRDIAKATLIQERICTTKAKAKEARKLVDRLITLGKKGTLAGRRKAFAILCDHTLVSRLFTTTAPRFTTRAGGYTRIIPLANRRGDNAELAYLELTEKSEVVVSEAPTAAAAKVKETKSKTEASPEKKVAKKATVKAKSEAKPKAEATKPKAEAKPKAKAKPAKEKK